MPRLPGHGLAVPDMRAARPFPWRRSKTHAKPPRERLGLARAGDTGLARCLAAAQPWEHGLAQTERGVSFRGTVTVLGAVASPRKSTPIPLTRARLLELLHVLGISLRP